VTVVASSARGGSPGDRGSYLPTLDGWRAVAILLVLLDHGADEILAALRGVGLRPPTVLVENAWWMKENAGRLGVHIFFTLSGYLITSRLVAEAKQGHVSLKAFYLRRLFRIQPAAITYLLVVGLLAQAGVLPRSPASWKSALLCYANLLPLPSWGWYTGHFWSLSIEEHFYLIWPVLFLLLGDRRRLAGALVLTVALSLWRAVAIKLQITMTAAWTVRTDMQAEYLMWGCLLALWQATPRWGPVLERLTGPVPCALGLMVMATAGLPATDNWVAQHFLRSAGAAATALVLVVTSTHATSWFGRCLELRPLKWLGRRSYSLYLWQELFFVWEVQRAPAMGRLQSLPWSVSCALAAAAASYCLIERPMIRLGQRVILRLRHRNEPIRTA
jgi:peptidoglycan/LPS O-acetylase OafA/YrhL